MTYLAILAPLVVACFALWLADSAYRRRERALDRREATWLAERAELLNRVMYMANKPWEMPAQPVEQTPEPSYVIDPLLEPLEVL